MDDLDGVIESAQRAVNAVSIINPHRLAYINDLGNLLRTRFEETGNLEDVNRAVELAQRVVGSITNESPAVASAFLSNLALALYFRSSQTESIHDLDMTIEIGRAAVELVPDGHPYESVCFANLSSSLLKRYERSGNIDLNVSIDLMRIMLGRSREQTMDQAIQLFSLCRALFRRFKKERCPTDLEEVLKGLQLALKIIPPGHRNRPAILDRLSIAFRASSELTNSMEDSNKAVEFGQTTVNVSSRTDPETPIILDELATTFKRFQNLITFLTLTNQLNSVALLSS